MCTPLSANPLHVPLHPTQKRLVTFKLLVTSESLGSQPYLSISSLFRIIQTFLSSTTSEEGHWKSLSLSVFHKCSQSCLRTVSTVTESELNINQPLSCLHKNTCELFTEEMILEILSRDFIVSPGRISLFPRTSLEAAEESNNMTSVQSLSEKRTPPVYHPWRETSESERVFPLLLTLGVV